MRIDPVELYRRLREKLLNEKTGVEARLNEINQVLEPAVTSPQAGAETPVKNVVRAKRRRPRKNALSQRGAVMKALEERGPLSRKELGQAIRDLGYISKAKDPLNSLGIVLYAKDAPFRKKDGKYFLPNAARPEKTDSDGEKPEKRKRVVSAEAKAKMVKAQRARRAKERKEK